MNSARFRDRRAFERKVSNGRRVGPGRGRVARGGRGKGASRARVRRPDPRAPWRSWRRSGASACPRSRRTGRRARAARRSRSSRARDRWTRVLKRRGRSADDGLGLRPGLERERDCGVDAARARRRRVLVPRVVTRGRTRARRGARYFASSRGFERPVFFGRADEARSRAVTPTRVETGACLPEDEKGFESRRRRFLSRRYPRARRLLKPPLSRTRRRPLPIDRRQTPHPQMIPSYRREEPLVVLRASRAP